MSRFSFIILIKKISIIIKLKSFKKSRILIKLKYIFFLQNKFYYNNYNNKNFDIGFLMETHLKLFFQGL